MRSHKSSFVLAAVTLPTLNPPTIIYDDMMPSPWKMFSRKGKFYSNWSPTVFDSTTSLTPLAIEKCTDPQKQNIYNPNKTRLDSTGHYQLSLLILRHCQTSQTDTGFSDDATRLSKDDTRWRWNHKERSFARINKMRKEKQRIGTTFTIFLFV